MGFDTLTGPNLAETATAWQLYTPVVTSASGTLTTTSATGRYRTIGKTVFIIVQLTITTNGSGATSILFTLPIVPGGLAQFYGREVGSSGKMLQGYYVGASQISMLNYDNTYPGASGAVLDVTGFYEAA